MFPEPPEAPIEHARGAARTSLLAARLEMPTPVTVRSGAPPRRLLAAHFEAEAAVEHQAAPRQSNAVFLAARFRNANAFPLLAGPVGLFIGSDYVGTAALRAVSIDDDVLLPFGADAGVTLDRTLADRELRQRGGRDDTTVRYQYRLTNHRGRAVTVTVLDRVPVSRSHGLTVRALPGDRAPEARREGDASGVVRWQVRADAGATARWSFGYVVSAPRRRAVEGLED